MYASKYCNTNGHIHCTTCAMGFETNTSTTALFPKLVDLLKEKMRMEILDPSMTPYSNRWFTIQKKSEALQFI